MRAHHRLIELNRADLKVYNTTHTISARLQHGSVTYFGDGPTVDAALAALDADIEGAASDCDCVLPEHTCLTCCPKEVRLDNIPF